MFWTSLWLGWILMGRSLEYARVIHMCSIFLGGKRTSAPTKTLCMVRTCELKKTVGELRWCYPEMLQGPERTNVKWAHVTHFYPKIIITDHPNYLGPAKIFNNCSPPVAACCSQMARRRFLHPLVLVSREHRVSVHLAQHQWKWLWLTSGKQHAEMEADGS